MTRSSNFKFIFFSVFLAIGLLASCDEKNDFDFNQHNKVAVITSAVEGISKNEVTLTGKVNTKNNAELTEIGFCYSMNNTPTRTNEIVLLSGNLDTGAYRLQVSGLKPSTKYYYRGFARNAYGIAYGEINSFSTERGYVAKVQILDPTNITRVSAELTGRVTDNGGYKISRHGICYSTTTSTPTTANESVLGDKNTNDFKVTLTGLSAGLRYYARAFVVNDMGTSYSEVSTFNTSPAILAVGLVTNTATGISQSSATLGGSVADGNGSPVTSRGICYSAYYSTPTTTNATVLAIGSGTGAFSTQVRDLQTNTTYYARSFATNGAGTAYGPVITFKTMSPELPGSVSTNYPTNITMTSATAGGSVGSAGGGAISAKGIVYSTSTSSPTIYNGTILNSGTSLGSFSVYMSYLSSNTTYYVRAFATNEAGTSYGTTYSFKTALPSLPTLTTYSASSIAANSAYLSGYVSTVSEGPVSNRGFVYSSNTYSPTLSNGSVITAGSGSGSFSATPTSLTSGTTYYVRSYATNEGGTSYGSVVTFTTLSISAPKGISTYSSTSVSYNYATLNGYVEANGGSSITEKGFVYSNNTSTPTINNGTRTVVSGTSVGSMSKYVSGLSSYSTYYVRAYASNAYGTTYGSTVSFYTY